MTDIRDFDGRVALVTGAASGIGAACAKALAARGCKKLFLNDVNADGIEALTLDCEVVPVIGSVADEAMWDALQPQLTGLDHAVVNAGVGGFGAVADLTFAEWRRVMDINLDGAFLTLRAALRAAQACRVMRELEVDRQRHLGGELVQRSEVVRIANCS